MYNERLIIGFAGCDGAGKSTLAEAVKEKLRAQDPQRVTRVMAYATALKLRVNDALSVLEYPLHTEVCSAFNKPTTPAMRKILEGFGDLYRSMIAHDFFVHEMARSVSRFKDDHVIIDDVRYVNEAKLIQELGGFVFYVGPWQPVEPPSLLERLLRFLGFKKPVAATKHELEHVSKMADWILGVTDLDDRVTGVFKALEYFQGLSISKEGVNGDNI